MQHFANQCLDLARSILGHNLDSINADGSIEPVPGEPSRPDEPGHAALAFGEYHRATGDVMLNRVDIVDLVSKAVSFQTHQDKESENGLAYAGLGLLSFGPSKERNAVWERLDAETRERLRALGYDE